MIKIGPFPVISVPSVVPANKAAPNVPIVHLVNIKTVPTTNAMHAQQDGTHWNWMLQSVPNVLQVKLHCQENHAIRAMLDVLAVQLVYAVHVWLVGINRTKAKRIVLVASMERSTKQIRLALIVKWVNEVAHHRERVSSAMLVHFKVKKAKQCVSSASMERSTKQDRPALNVKLVNGAVHQMERAWSAMLVHFKIKKVKHHVRIVSMDTSTKQNRPAWNARLVKEAARPWGHA